MLQIDGCFMSVLASVDTDSVICELSQRGNKNLPDDKKMGLIPKRVYCQERRSADTVRIFRGRKLF